MIPVVAQHSCYVCISRCQNVNESTEHHTPTTSICFTHAFTRRNRHKSIAHAPNTNGISIKNHFLGGKKTTCQTYTHCTNWTVAWLMHGNEYVIDHFTHAKHAFDASELMKKWIIENAPKKCTLYTKFWLNFCSQIDPSKTKNEPWKTLQPFEGHKANLEIISDFWSALLSDDGEVKQWHTIYRCMCNSDCAGNCLKPFSMSHLCRLSVWLRWYMRNTWYFRTFCIRYLPTKRLAVYFVVFRLYSHALHYYFIPPNWALH